MTQAKLPTSRAHASGVTTRISILLIAIAIQAIAAHGQELGHYLKVLDENNPNLQSQRLQAQAADERATTSKTLPDPELAVGQYLRSVETRVGPQRQMLSLSQRFPLGGKRDLAARRDRARADAAWAQYQAQRNRLHRDFTKIFADYYHLGQSIEITQSHLALIQDLRSVIQSKYESGTAPYASLIRIELESDTLGDRLQTIAQLADPLRARLNALMDRPASEPIPFPSSLPEIAIAPNASVSDHPELKQLQQRTAERQSIEALARKRRIPDLKIGLSWIRTGNAINPSTSGSGDDPIVLQAGINLPIWRRSIAAHQRAAALETQASEYTQRDRANDLQARWERARYERDDAMRKLALYRETLIPKARESLNVLETAFQSEQATYLDIIEAERVLLEFELSLHRAEADRLAAEAQMDYLTGSGQDTGGLQ